MSDILAFAEARLAEDEALAQRAAAKRQAPWRLIGAKGFERVVSALPNIDLGVADTPASGNGRPGAIAAHITRHDPARALREVTAKRAILEPHYPGLPPGGAPEGLVICTGCEADGDTWQMATRWPCPDVRAIAAVWNDHPDYDPAWAQE